MKNGLIDDESLIRTLSLAVEKKLIKTRIGKSSRSLVGNIAKAIERGKVVKESIDARKEITLVLSVEFDIDIDKESAQIFSSIPDFTIIEKDAFSLDQYLDSLKLASTTEKNSLRPIVVGFGPAGMFCAYILALSGLRPVVIERGKDVDTRSEDVEKFWKHGELDEESNVQFGEGGAGTFSDGKLTSRSKDRRSELVMEILHRHGAPKDVTYKSKPHVGTDLLKGVVKNMREFILSNGGEILFETKLVKIIHDCGNVSGVTVSSAGKNTDIACDYIALAIGHSARDTFRMLHDSGVAIGQKPFAVGVRIEHPRELINESQYKSKEAAILLGAAEYFLTHKCSNGRSAYTFCMCPGGEVVAAATRKGELVVNGMSYHARNLKNSNSALLVNVTPEDFRSDDPLAGIAFQEEIEKKAYELGGGGFIAPVQSVGEFLGNIAKNYESKVKPSYSLGTKESDLASCLPEFVVEALKEAISGMARKLKGFDLDCALLTGVETRTSSPVRIIRKEDTLESISLNGIYPCGEGAGYAGGIVSSAIDGIKIAEKIISKVQG